MEHVKEYEAMAKLDLPEDERESITEYASALTKSFQAFDDVATDGVEPLFTVLDVRNVFREDVSVKTFSREELLENAPMQYDGYFQVPKTR